MNETMNQAKKYHENVVKQLKAKEERLQKALDYLEEHKVLKVAQYMELTGQGHTTSACELRAFSQDASSGIVAIGRGSSVVYVKGIR